MKINEKCECITCHECDGSGSIWISYSGKYMGKHRCDDLDEMDTCGECGGEGITSMCLKCQLEYEDEQEDW